MSKRILNHGDSYESIGVFTLTKDKFPIAFGNKVEELMEQGCTREEAEKLVGEMEIELEIYYEKGTGLFAVESEAVECTPIFSPYTKEEYVFEAEK